MSNCASCLVSLIPAFLPYKKIFLVTWMPCLHQRCTRNLRSNKVDSVTRKWSLHQQKHTGSAQARGQGTAPRLVRVRHSVKQAIRGTLCTHLLGVLHPTLSYATLKKIPLGSCTAGLCVTASPRMCGSGGTVANHYLEMGVYSPESCICCLADTAVHLLHWTLTTPSIFFHFPAAGLQKMQCCPHLPHSCQLCFTCSMSCRRRIFIWWLPRCPWATASSSLGLPADLSPFQKLSCCRFYTALAPHGFWEHFALFTESNRSLQRGCWVVFVTPLCMPDSLLARGDRALSALRLKHTLCHKLLPGCSFAFKSLVTACLRLYSMLAQSKVQTSANKPAQLAQCNLLCHPQNR